MLLDVTTVWNCPAPTLTHNRNIIFEKENMLGG
jgi:hypothetical protein